MATKPRSTPRRTPNAPWREAWNRFKAVRRAKVSLYILLALFALSMVAETISNDKPLALSYNGRLYFPIVAFYPGVEFGGRYRTEADYLALRDDPAFLNAGGWMVLPSVPWGPVRSDLDQPGAPPHPPSAAHWLGTDNAARDVFSRMLYGFRISMIFALLLLAGAVVLGVVIGAVQGFFGGWIDLAGQRLIEIWSALPFLYVVILIGSIYGRDFWILLGVMSLFEWIGLSLYIRAEFLRLKVLPYVAASRAAGASWARIVFRQILPNALTPVVTLAPFIVVGGISSLTALDYLGFGLPPPTPSWGEMLDQGMQDLTRPWIALSALGALFVTLLLAVFIGEGVREALDPKSLNRLQ